MLEEYSFISSKFVVKERVMHSKSNNIKVKSYNDENGVVDELFESLQWIYQGNLKTSMRWKNFIFDSVQLMYCKYQSEF